MQKDISDTDWALTAPDCAALQEENRMPRVAVMTDSNSGITQMDAKNMGIDVVPMPFTIDDKTYFEDINLTREEFFQI